MPNAGESWNQFKLVKPLGSGGMGLVYLADDGALERKVALKFLPGALREDAEARERFRREAKSAAALDHPYICKIFEVGEVEGAAFIAMEYVDGITLRERLAKKPLPLEELLRLASEITEAVEAAHKKQIIHRDLKTPNIMLTGDGHVKVMDFGLAKQIQSDPGVDSKVDTFSGQPTSQGSTPGTVIYMSPEQVRGEPLDVRSDIFSLGVVLYEMATGLVPFQGATSGLTYDAILNRGAAPLSKFNRQIPTEFERIVDKSLEKDRENRYQSARDILVDLRRLTRDTVSGESSLPPRPLEPHHGGPGERVRGGGRWALIAGAVALALAGGWALLKSPSGSTPAAISTDKAVDSLAVLPFDNASNDPDVDYLSDGIAEDLINRLSQHDQLQVMARSTAFRHRGPNVDPLAVGRELGVGAVVTGRVVQQGDALNVQAELVDVESGRQLWGQQYNHPITDLITVQNALATEITDALRLQLTGDVMELETANSEAYQAYLRGRFLWNKRTNADFRRAINYFDEAIAADPGYALAYVGLADSYMLLGSGIYGREPDFATMQMLEESRRAAARALELNPRLGEAHATLGFVEFLGGWDWPKAEEEFQLAVSLAPNYPSGHQWYSQYLTATMRFDEAIAEASRALELEPSSLVMNRQLGLVLMAARQYGRAITQLEKTMELEPSFPLAQDSLVMALWLDGDRERAIAEAESRNPVLGAFYRLVAEGKKAEARRLMDERADVFTETNRLLFFYGLADDRDALFQRFNEWIDAREPLVALNVGLSSLDSVVSDPRYAEALSRIGLEPPQ